jgi:NAD(P)-dependent dehydrogenase (short-subunit alcohol dehydrogenase family)
MIAGEMAGRSLDGMVVIITGASAGIGKALAEALSRRGARLALAARRLDRLEALASMLATRPLIERVDVSREEDCRRLIERAAEHFGRIDTLVCNAGYGVAKSVVETTRAEMEQIFATNVYGTSDCIRFAVPVMENQDLRGGVRGQVMIVSSAAARRGLPFFGPYAATKFAQLALSEALRVELAPKSIAVTSVHPIGTETDFFTTAESLGAVKMGPRGRGEVRQTPATVARKMIRGIQRPRPEVWPFRPARWALSFATLMPSVADRVMAKYRGEMEERR